MIIKMKHCSYSSLNVLVLMPNFLIHFSFDPFHLKILFPYILLSTSHLGPSSPPT